MKWPVEPAPDSHAETRRQLLEAAGQVFAECGFRNATVRQICLRAGANVAAINYHFGDKATLYLEVLRYAQSRAFARYPLLLDVAEDAPPKDKLRAYIKSTLLRVFDKNPTSWHGKILSREMIEPTPALDSLVEERMRPMARQLGEIVAGVLECPVTDERVRLCAFSVVSQCVFYHHCRPVVSRLFPEQAAMELGDVERLADHIARFSLAAMKHLSKPKH